MRKIIIIAAIVLILLLIIPFIFRFTKDIKKKLNYPNTYAIQNVQTGKDIRVSNADYHDNAKIILYPHHNRECITWEMIQLADSTYLLKNLYTQKTFEPVAFPAQGVSLWQKPLGYGNFQYWEFIRQNDSVYYIRLKGTDLFITVSSNEDNSELLLQPLKNSDSQKWKLIRQNPVI